MSNSKNFFFKPISTAWTSYFRIIFGLLMCFDLCGYFRKGWFQENYIDTIFHFKFYAFSWIVQPPGAWMVIYLCILILSTLFIIIGYQYRFAMITFFTGYTYLWLIDPALFVEWNYLISLIALLMIFFPANQFFSLDVILKNTNKKYTSPQWMLYLIRFQFAVVYIFGGIHKLNTDWLKGDLVAGWLAYGYEIPFLGTVKFTSEWLVQLLTFCGIGFDLFVVPLLLFKRTRVLALVLTILFHLHNIIRYPVGIFPYLMIAGTFLFIDPDIFRKLFQIKEPITVKEGAQSKTEKPKLLVLAISLYCIIQIIIPLRHNLYPGNADFTEEGMHFSWFLYTSHKSCSTKFLILDNQNNTYAYGPSEILKILTGRQYYYMSRNPDLILQFAHYLSKNLEEQGMSVQKITALTNVQMNMREGQPLIDPNVNLLDKELSLTHKDWVYDIN